MPSVIQPYKSSTIIGLLVLFFLSGINLPSYAASPTDFQAEDLIQAMLRSAYFDEPCETSADCPCPAAAFEAEYRLCSLGEEAFLTLLKYAQDERPSCRTTYIQGRYDESLGALCWSMMTRHLEGASLTAVPGHYGLDAVPQEHRIYGLLPRQMVMDFIRQHIGTPLREVQIAAAEYAIELCLRDQRVCSARIWRERLKTLNAEQLPAVDPKEWGAHDFNPSVFVYDPRVVLDLIWQDKIKAVRILNQGGLPGRPTRPTVLDFTDKTLKRSFYDWLGTQSEVLNNVGFKPVPSVSVTEDETEVGSVLEEIQPARYPIKIQVSCGADSSGATCWDPFMSLVLPDERLDVQALLDLWEKAAKKPNFATAFQED